MKTFLILLVVLLCGCDLSHEKERLQAENNQLKAALELARSNLAFKEAERLADLVYIDRQVAIAAACDWIVPLCPRSLTTTGRQALEEGHGGGVGWLFWMIATLKFIFLGGACGAAVAGFKWVWLRAVRPEAASLEHDIRMIANAERIAAAAHANTAADEARSIEAVKVTEQANARLRDLLHAEDLTCRRLEKVMQKLAEIEANIAENVLAQDEVNSVLFTVFHQKE